jgi:hypothetical protein
MSNLRNMIRESGIIKKELTPCTVRISKELNAFIDELSDHINLSKQETMLKLLEEGVSIAKSELKLDTIETEEQSNFHLLNTNKINNEDDHKFMIENGVAAAFYDPWKHNIEKIKKGDIVFLYESGVGIVAFGKGTGETKIEDQPNGDKNERYYQSLSEFKKIKEPLKASDIKKILGKKIVFMKTMSSIQEGQKLLNEIRIKDIGNK